jgi:hypothetical protein
MHRNEKARHFLTTFRRFGVVGERFTAPSPPAHNILAKPLYNRHQTWYHIPSFDRNQHLSRDCPPARVYSPAHVTFSLKCYMGCFSFLPQAFSAARLVPRAPVFAFSHLKKPLIASAFGAM